MNSCENNLSLCSAKTSQNKAILIAGPTASGKSGVAVKIAQKANGVIINADSMQIYQDVPVLTARPNAQEMAGIDHCLYGFLQPHDTFSVFKWAESAAQQMQRIWQAGKIPVIVGGTGLYFQTLVNGISPVPETNNDIRTAIRHRFDQMGADAFIADFQQKDPTFSFTDPQRVVRAAEVLEQTGKSITYWQSLPFRKLIEADYFSIFMNPERQELYRRCHLRFDLMMQNGAVEQTKLLLAKNPPADSLIMKAIGVAEISAMLRGEITENQAVDKARQMTRNYAKRQVTWFSHRFKSDKIAINDKTDDLLTNALHFLG